MYCIFIKSFFHNRTAYIVFILNPVTYKLKLNIINKQPNPSAHRTMLFKYCTHSSEQKTESLKFSKMNGSITFCWKPSLRITLIKTKFYEKAFSFYKWI